MSNVDKIRTRNKKLENIIPFEKKEKNNRDLSTPNNNNRKKLLNIDLKDVINFKGFDVDTTLSNNDEENQKFFLKESLFMLKKNKPLAKIINSETSRNDINPLTSYYYYNSNKNEKYQNILNQQSSNKNSDKRSILQKHGIKNKSNREVYTEISSILSRKPSCLSTHRSQEKIKVDINEKYFRCPYMSQDKLNLNKQIYNKVNNLTFQIQAKVFNESYIKISKEEKKIDKMPEIRTSVNPLLNNETANKTFYSPQIKQTKSLNQKSVLNNDINELDNGLIGHLIINSSNKPKSRAQTSGIVSENHLYIFGGFNNEPMNDLWICNLNDNYKWKKLAPKGILPSPRYGHTAVLFKNEIYIFGGFIDSKIYKQEDLVIYNIISNEYIVDITTVNKSGFLLRRSHISEIIGSYMIIYGGISDELDKYLDDLWAIDLSTNLRWNLIQTIGVKPPALANCCSTLVLQNSKRMHPIVNLFKLPELPQGRYNRNIKYEGLYLFGGNDSEGNINDSLFILRIGKKPLEWICPEIQGENPIGFVNSTLTYSEGLNLVILFGGKSKNQDYHNQLYLLDLEKFYWTKIRDISPSPARRSSHFAFSKNTELILFGGINETHFVGSDLFAINLNFLPEFKIDNVNDPILRKFDMNKFISNSKGNSILINLSKSPIHEKNQRNIKRIQFKLYS